MCLDDYILANQDKDILAEQVTGTQLEYLGLS